MSAITEMPVNVECEVVNRKKCAYDAFDTSVFEADGDPPKYRLIDGKVHRRLYNDSIKAYIPFHGSALQDVPYDVYYCDNSEDIALVDRDGIPVVMDRWHRDIVEDGVRTWLEDEERGMAWGYDDVQDNKCHAARERGE